MADPAERSATSDPQAGRNDQPENPGKYATVVELAYAGNNKTQDSSQKWIAHLYEPPLGNSYDSVARFVLLKKALFTIYPPDIDYFTAKSAKHLLYYRITLSRFA